MILAELDAAVAAKALAYDAAAEEARRLKRERAKCLCEVAEPPEPDVGSAGVMPCWKTWDTADFDDGRGMVSERLDTAEWCETCRRREEFHLAYVAAGRRKASAARSLHAACARHRAALTAEGAGR